MSNSTSKKQEHKKQFTRIVCLVIAGVMVVTMVAAAVMANIW